MKQIALTVEQMDHLKKLGINTSKAGMKFISIYPSYNYSEEDKCEFIPVDNRFCAKLYNEHGNTFTLQDVLELLPNFISKDGYIYDLTSDMHNSMIYKRDWDSIEDDELLDEDDFYLHIESDGSNLLKMAYRMLCWVAKNGYLNKEE